MTTASLTLTPNEAAELIDSKHLVTSRRAHSNALQYNAAPTSLKAKQANTTTLRASSRLFPLTKYLYMGSPRNLSKSGGGKLLSPDLGAIGGPGGQCFEAPGDLSHGVPTGCDNHSSCRQAKASKQHPGRAMTEPAEPSITIHATILPFYRIDPSPHGMAVLLALAVDAR